MADPKNTDYSSLFRSLVDQYSEPLYWHVRNLVNSHDDADDIVQECFIKAWKAMPSFRGDSSYSTWLWRIATNEALSFLRKQKVRAALRLEPISAEVERLVASDPWFDGDSAQVKLQQAIASLPQKQRLVFNMRYYDEMKYEDMSEILGTSVGALKASYHHAIKKIEAFFGEND
jgi:RNA polymerase sigma-70 factor (ECF subfamily)